MKKNNTTLKINKSCLLSSLIALLAIAGAEAQNSSATPRLVINITIDQLRTDYMEAFAPLYGEDGFKRLLTQGRVYPQAEFPFVNIDRASAAASLSTGATPYENGITASKWFNRATLRPVYCVDDAAYAGLNTSHSSSPQHLTVSTIGDELKVSTEGKAIVYSIAPFREAAILSAGHAADGAFWIDDESGDWCGSSYYGGLPRWIAPYNRVYGLSKTLPTFIWEPSNAFVGQFNYFVSGGEKQGFKHSFKQKNSVKSFKTSGCVNAEVNGLVEQCLSSSTIGIDEVTDYLSIMYYAGNFEHKTITECPIELQDTYVRLDRELGRLINLLDKQIGNDHVLYVITSTGYSDQETLDLAKYRIPSGDFSMSKASSLLNLYLMAIYGSGQYVEASFEQQLFLNHKLIEEKQLSLTEVQERAQEMLIQMSGVKDVYTSHRLILGAWTPGISRIRNSYNPKYSGDIYIEVAPGWQLVNEETNQSRLMRESYFGFPLILFGYGVKTEIVHTPVVVSAIAPTLANFMRIRAPNACATPPLSGVR